ncbi:expressed protein [Echinococcus multilocularis]|uniref:Expressed protein n=1 Tax=Echinococcus multilocularis TaxID=6211 RepID=A0A068Y2S2_ECHMU|nr:expressed protein [Echinococcus multilocularis]
MLLACSVPRVWRELRTRKQLQYRSNKELEYTILRRLEFVGTGVACGNLSQETETNARKQCSMLPALSSGLPNQLSTVIYAQLFISLSTDPLTHPSVSRPICLTHDLPSPSPRLCFTPTAA